MAEEWIKMRPSLVYSHKVNAMARMLERDLFVTRRLAPQQTDEHMEQVVSRNVMRNVCVTGLLLVWGAANEHTKDGVFKNADLETIDDIAGIPFFGAAMESVGWAVYDQEEGSVTLPNFSDYNVCGHDRAREKNRERQARYRAKQREESNDSHNVSSNVTNNVINNDREEKRREENNKGASRFTPPSISEVKAYCQERGNSVNPEKFVDHYAANGWMRGKSKIKDWKACVRTWEKDSQGTDSTEKQWMGV